MNLIAIVKLCVGVLQNAKMAEAEKERFVQAAWALITHLAFDLADRVQALPAAARRAAVQNVDVAHVVTSLLYEILKARKLKASSLRPHVVVRDNEAFARGAGWLGKTGEWESWETGSTREDSEEAFEALLWKEVFRGYAEGARAYRRGCSKRVHDPDCRVQDCDRKKLFGVLKAEQAGERFVMVPERHVERYEGIAVSFPQISFVESADSAAGTMGIDEHQLAHLIARFIRASSSKETP